MEHTSIHRDMASIRKTSARYFQLLTELEVLHLVFMWALVFQFSFDSQPIILLVAVFHVLCAEFT